MTESDIWSQIISSLSCFTCPCSFLKPTPSCGLWIPYPLHQQRPCPWIVLFLLCHQCLLCWICNQHRNVLENVTASSGKSKVTNDFQVAKSTAFFFFPISISIYFPSSYVIIILTFFTWKKIALQCCVGFCQTTQISHDDTYIPSFVKPPHLPSTHRSRSSQSTRMSSLLNPLFNSQASCPVLSSLWNVCHPVK